MLTGWPSKEAKLDINILVNSTKHRVNNTVHIPQKEMLNTKYDVKQKWMVVDTESIVKMLTFSVTNLTSERL